MKATFAEALASWRAQFPEITEQDALADLWHKGFQNEATYRAHNQRTADRLDAENGVIKHPNGLRGYHVVCAALYKPGVYRFMATRQVAGGHECVNGFCAQSILTTAIELGLCTKPNGFTFPTP